jgi:type III pantothenate kinase
MNLVIDIGNTQFKVCVFDKNEITYHAFFKTIANNLLPNLISEFSIQQGIYSDTRGIDKQELQKQLPKDFNLIELTSDLPLPIKLDYKTPETLGKDRIAGAVGGYNQFPNSPILLIDIGTAITIDYISADGIFQGGIISPGPEIRYKALHQFTGKLPLLEPEPNPNLLGKTTRESILAGVQNGILYEILGYITHYNKSTPEIKIIVTGGYAYLFDNKINYPIFVDSFIIPKGLNSILEFNTKN